MSRNRLVVPQAEALMDHLKMETARELGLDDDIREKGWGNMTTREVGKIGGNMVRKMVAFAQQEMANHPDQMLK